MPKKRPIGSKIVNRLLFLVYRAGPNAPGVGPFQSSQGCLRPWIVSAPRIQARGPGHGALVLHNLRKTRFWGGRDKAKKTKRGFTFSDRIGFSQIVGSRSTACKSKLAVARGRTNTVLLVPLASREMPYSRRTVTPCTASSLYCKPSLRQTRRKRV